MFVPTTCNKKAPMTFRSRIAIALTAVCVPLLWTSLLAQDESAPQTVPPAAETGAMAGSTGQPAPPPAPADSADYAALRGITDRLNRASQTTVMDLGALQIERWRADRSQKQQAQDRAESLQRNLTAAVPELTQKALAAPGDIAPSFRLYRNLNVLFDVLASMTESVGTFGSKDHYQRLTADVNEMDSIRRALADRLDTLASARDGELANLRARARAQSAQAQTNAPVKKVVVDDTKPTPAPKPVKKKPKAPAVPPAQTGDTPKQ